VAFNFIAQWDGASWVGLGSGTNGPVQTLAVFDDGSGAALYAAGNFTTAGGAPATYIAKWNGSSWSSVGGGTNSTVGVVSVFDDGGGDALYAAGSFTSAGGVPVARIAKWNGSNWSPLGAGINNYVFALAGFDDGTGPGLHAGGVFHTGPAGDSYLAKWGCPTPPSSTAYCTAGTTTNGCVPSISGVGSASASAGSGFTISVAGVEGQKLGLVFYGISGANALPWGLMSTSFVCVKQPQQRMGQTSSGGTSDACDGVLSADWNAYIASHPSSLGQPFSGGETVWAQAWFRDPPAPKTTNLSDGLVFVVAP
jgi:hypothetical protein